MRIVGLDFFRMSSLANTELSSGERAVLSTTTLRFVVLNALANIGSDDFRLVMLHVMPFS